mmetsp:Transcript_4558/g.13113  ORF Transcript_4558/g.13113 Transcript_4558/m.13113 type:complete len:217 (-) Transcript_4558:2762-3412(-)
MLCSTRQARLRMVSLAQKFFMAVTTSSAMVSTCSSRMARSLTGLPTEAPLTAFWTPRPIPTPGGGGLREEQMTRLISAKRPRNWTSAWNGCCFMAAMVAWIPPCRTIWDLIMGDNARFTIAQHAMACKFASERNFCMDCSMMSMRPFESKVGGWRCCPFEAAAPAEDDRAAALSAPRAPAAVVAAAACGTWLRTVDAAPRAVVSSGCVLWPFMVLS